MEVCDPHVHFWSPETHAWLKGALDESAPPQLRRFFSIARPFWPDEYRRAMDPIVVTHAVYVQANMHMNTSALEEMAFIDGMSKACPFLSGVIAYAPLHKPKEAEATISRLRSYSTFRGVRFMLDYHPTRPELSQTDRGDYMENPDFIEGVRLLDGLIFDLQLCQCQLLEASKFCDKFDNVTFVLNHTGFPLRGEFDEWLEGIRALASCKPPVYCKLGALGCYDDTPWSQEEINKYVQATLDAFGEDRCCFSSNLPVDLVDTTPAERYKSFEIAVQDRSEETKRKLFRENALRIYRLT